MQHFNGISTYPGVIFAKARVLVKNQAVPKQELIEPTQCNAEVLRFQTAIHKVKEDLTALRQASQQNSILRELLEVYILILTDQQLVSAVSEIIYRQHYNAEWALQVYRQGLIDKCSSTYQQALNTSSTDIGQLCDYVLLALARPDFVGTELAQLNCALLGTLPPNNESEILVVKEISIADLLIIQNTNFAGLIVATGGRYDHLTIVAQSLKFPVLIAVQDAHLKIKNGAELIFDGIKGMVIHQPTRQQYQRYQQQKALSTKPSQDDSTDGDSLTNIKVLLNINFSHEIELVEQLGADGVGLLRSEFLFIPNNSRKLLDEEFQYNIYRQLAKQSQQFELTIRTLDIGLDKNIFQHKFSNLSESALGMRSIRWSLQQPEVFSIQLRAILRAANFGKINVLIPMITNLAEIKAIHKSLAQAKQQLAQGGTSYGQIKLGMMVEVPAAALLIDNYIKYFDFVSIGTNDLTQYVLATDRTDSEVAYLYDNFHPAVLKLVKHVIEVANQAAKPVTVCGELAGDTKAAALLVDMGLKNFSVHPTKFRKIKQHLRQTNLAK